MTVHTTICLLEMLLFTRNPCETRRQPLLNSVVITVGSQATPRTGSVVGRRCMAEHTDRVYSGLADQGYYLEKTLELGGKVHNFLRLTSLLHNWKKSFIHTGSARSFQSRPFNVTQDMYREAIVFNCEKSVAVEYVLF